MKKKLIIKILVAFMIGAVILTYISGQVYNSTIPVVTTAESFSASLQVNEDTVGKIVYQDTALLTSPVDVTAEEVFVKPGEKITEGQQLLKLNASSLKTKKEELNNQLAQMNFDAKQIVKDESILQFQIELAELELSLFKSNHELDALIEDKNHEADILEHKEKIEQTNLQMELAQESLDNYVAPTKVDGEERALMRAIERIKIQLKDQNLIPEEREALEQKLKDAELDLRVYRKLPSLSSSNYDISQELNLKLALLQAKNNLLEVNSDYGADKNSAQLRYEASLYEYQQSQIKNASQIKIDEKKLELSLAQYKQQLNDLHQSSKAKTSQTMKIKEINSAITMINSMLEEDGILRSETKGEIVEVNVTPNSKVSAESTMIKLCDMTKSVGIEWKMSTDDFSVGDEIKADLTVYETVNGDDGEKTIEKEKATKLFISEKRFIAEEDLFEYTALIPLYDPLKEGANDTVRLAMSNNQSVKISMSKSKSDEPYETVIPISAVSFIDEHTGTVFCAVANKQGKLVARKIEVDILDYDKKNAALEKSIKDKIVVFSDRPLTGEGVIKEDG